MVVSLSQQQICADSIDDRKRNCNIYAQFLPLATTQQMNRNYLLAAVYNSVEQTKLTCVATIDAFAIGCNCVRKLNGECCAIWLRFEDCSKYCDYLTNTLKSSGKCNCGHRFVSQYVITIFVGFCIQHRWRSNKTCSRTQVQRHFVQLNNNSLNNVAEKKKKTTISLIFMNVYAQELLDLRSQSVGDYFKNYLIARSFECG